MKLYGSLQNRIMEEGAQKLKPEVGMGAMFIGYSDIDAGTVIEVVSSDHIRVQFDKVIMVDKDGNENATFDYGDEQHYHFEPDPKAPIHDCWLRKDGKWHDGRNMRSRVVRLGTRVHFYDPSF